MNAESKSKTAFIIIGQQGQYQYGKPHAVRTRQLVRNIDGAHEQCAVELHQQV